MAYHDINVIWTWQWDVHVLHERDNREWRDWHTLQTWEPEPARFFPQHSKQIFPDWTNNRRIEHQETVRQDAERAENKRKGTIEQYEEAKRNADDQVHQEMLGAFNLWLIISIPIFCVLLYLYFHKGIQLVQQFDSWASLACSLQESMSMSISLYFIIYSAKNAKLLSVDYFFPRFALFTSAQYTQSNNNDMDPQLLVFFCRMGQNAPSVNSMLYHGHRSDMSVMGETYKPGKHSSLLYSIKASAYHANLPSFFCVPRDFLAVSKFSA